MKPPQSYSFWSIHWAIPISVTNNPRVCSKITPYDTHQSTLMSPRYSNVTTSICGWIIWYASNNLRFIIFNPTQRTSKIVQDFYRRNKDENVHQPLCIDYPNVTSGIHELSSKTYIKWINRTSHCHHRYPIARHTSSVLKSNTQSNIMKPQRVRLNSSEEGREARTP